jgi:hypothetical protein
MNWRYGNEKTEIIYPKLLLQIVNIRSLSLDHAEIIQKAMSTSSVDPLVKEVTAKHEHFHKPTTDRISKECHVVDRMIIAFVFRFVINRIHSK